MIGDVDLHVVHRNKRDWCLHDIIVLIVLASEYVHLICAFGFGYFLRAYLLVF